MASVWESANPQLRDIAVHEVGKPIEEMARELGVDAEAIIKLASNEKAAPPAEFGNRSGCPTIWVLDL